MQGVRDRVGMLCDQLSRWPDLDGIIRDGGAGGELDELLAALGGEDEPDKDRLLAWVQDIEDACASKGLVGITSREHAFRPLPEGLFAAHGSRAWVCPRGRCDRVVLPEDAQAPPVCAVAGGAPMKALVLPSS
jgi:hypothetical protein